MPACPEGEAYVDKKNNSGYIGGCKPKEMKAGIDRMDIIKILAEELNIKESQAQAAVKLIERLGGEVVKIVFLMELEGLKGREKLKGYNVESVIRYEGK